MAAQVFGAFSSPKNAAANEKQMVKALSLLIDVVSTKRSLYVKARDLAAIYGYNHYWVTQLGKLLALLERLGLAERHNGSRPVRYTLKPKTLWREFIKRCSSRRQRFRCESEGTVCGLAGICPYWVLKEGFKRR